MDVDQPPPSPPHPADESSAKSCFICFETEEETPGQVWVTPCPCTLEAHESCMLQWIAETETSGGGRKKLRCPACNSRIRITEPWDPIVALGDRYRRMYGKASYLVLASTFMTMGVVGSGYYGLQSMISFAGPQPTMSWLGIRRIVMSNSRDAPLSWRDGAVLVWKFYLLNLLAPCLIFHRALPSLGDAIAVPVACFYSFLLNVKKTPLTWPPTPEWALATLPFVSLGYSRAYYGLFGSFERKLNQALHGRGAPQAAAGEGEQPARGDGEAAAQNNQRREGVFAALWRFGLGVADFVHNDHGVMIENAGAVAAFDNGQGVEFQLELIVGEDDNQRDDDPPPPPPPVNDRARHEREQGGNGAQGAAPAGDDPQPRPAEEAVENGEAGNVANNNNGGNGAVVNGEENRAVTPFSDIITAMATQLLLPRISGLVGQILENILPRSWVTRPAYRRSTGLLQEKWGRSLVGGCLFIVLRDLVNLYMKYRRVQVKKQRKIKNIDRKKLRGGNSTAASS